MSKLKDQSGIGQEKIQSVQQTQTCKTAFNESISIKNKKQDQKNIIPTHSNTFIPNNKEQNIPEQQQKSIDNPSLIQSEEQIHQIHSLKLQTKSRFQDIQKLGIQEQSNQGSQQITSIKNQQNALKIPNQSITLEKNNEQQNTTIQMRISKQILKNDKSTVQIEDMFVKQNLVNDKLIQNMDYGCEISIINSGVINLKEDVERQQCGQTQKQNINEQLQKIKVQYQILKKQYSQKIKENTNMKQDIKKLKKDIQNLTENHSETERMALLLEKQIAQQTSQIEQKRNQNKTLQEGWNQSYDQLKKQQIQHSFTKKLLELANYQLEKNKKNLEQYQSKYYNLQKQLSITNRQLIYKGKQLLEIKLSNKSTQQRFQNIKNIIYTKVETHISYQKQYLKQIKTKVNKLERNNDPKLQPKQIDNTDNVKKQTKYPINLLPVNYVSFESDYNDLKNKVKQCQNFTVEILKDICVNIDYLKEENDKLRQQLKNNTQNWISERNKMKVLMKKMVEQIDLLEQQNHQLVIKILKTQQDFDFSINFQATKNKLLEEKLDSFTMNHNYYKIQMQKKIHQLQFQINDERISLLKEYDQKIAILAKTFQELRNHLCQVYELEIKRINNVLKNYKLAFKMSDKISSEVTRQHEEKVIQFQNIKKKMQDQYQKKTLNLLSQIENLEKNLDQKDQLLNEQNVVHRSVILKENQIELKEQTYCDILIKIQLKQDISWATILNTFLVQDVFGLFKPLTQIFCKADEIKKKSEKELINTFNQKINEKQEQISKIQTFLQEVISNKDKIVEQNINEINQKNRQILELKHTINEKQAKIEKLMKQISLMKETNDIKQFYEKQNEILKNQLQSIKNSKHLMPLKVKETSLKPEIFKFYNKKQNQIEKKNTNENKSMIRIDNQDEQFVQPTLIMRQEKLPQLLKINQTRNQEKYFLQNNQNNLEINQTGNDHQEPSLIWRQKQINDHFSSIIQMENQIERQEEHPVLKQLSTASKILSNQQQQIYFLIHTIQNFSQKRISSVQLKFQMSKNCIQPNTEAKNFSSNNILWLFRSQDSIFGFVSFCSQVNGRISLFLFNTTNRKAIYPSNMKTTFIPIKCQQYHLKLGVDQLRYTWKSKFFAAIKSKNASLYFDSNIQIIPAIMEKQRVEVLSFEIFFLKFA